MAISLGISPIFRHPQLCTGYSLVVCHMAWKKGPGSMIVPLKPGAFPSPCDSFPEEYLWLAA